MSTGPFDDSCFHCGAPTAAAGQLAAAKDDLDTVLRILEGLDTRVSQFAPTPALRDVRNTIAGLKARFR